LIPIATSFVEVLRRWIESTQFTDSDFTDRLKAHGIAISMDGKRRWIDNVFIERLWRTVKYEEVYLRAYDSLSDARVQLKVFLDRYNDFRPHQALANRTPDAVYFEALAQGQRKAA
jgi:putative transposase